MAILINRKTHKKLYLRPLHVFGRNPLKADTLLTNGGVSQIHASVRWNGKLWEIIDHSRNGTMVNDKRLVPDTRMELKIGQKIMFTPEEELSWLVASLEAPATMLLPSSDEAPILLDDFHFLPDDILPEASVYMSSRGQWVFESDHETLFLHDGDILRLGENSWKFVVGARIESTSDVARYRFSRAEDTLFSFAVSLDEEHISLTISNAKKKVELGERTHHYSLLILARQRFKDAERGIEESSQGWMEVKQLSKMLGLDAAHLNIQIFRARSQIARAFPDDLNLLNFVERRRGEMRFGAFRVQIVRGSSVEAIFDPASLPSTNDSHPMHPSQGIF